MRWFVVAGLGRVLVCLSLYNSCATFSTVVLCLEISHLGVTLNCSPARFRCLALTRRCFRLLLCVAMCILYPQPIPRPELG